MRCPTALSLPALLLLPALLATPRPCTGAELLAPGDPAPRFTFSDIRNGETKSFTDVAGDGPLLLVFLQTACRSCVREMVALKNVRADVGGFEILGVFLDLKPRGLEEYVEDYELPFTFTWDGSYTTADAYGVSFSPTAFLLDAERRIAAVYAGFTLATEADLRADLLRVLARR